MLTAMEANGRFALNVMDATANLKVWSHRLNLK